MGTVTGGGGGGGRAFSINTWLKSLLSTFTDTQRAPVKLNGRFQTSGMLAGKENHRNFLVVFFRQSFASVSEVEQNWPVFS